MRSLYESILDDDEVVAKAVHKDAIVKELFDNGIYFATQNNCNNWSLGESGVTISDGTLFGYSDKTIYGSEIIINWDMAQNYIKRHVKCIDAPKVRIVNIKHGNFDNLTIYASALTIHSDDADTLTGINYISKNFNNKTTRRTSVSFKNFNNNMLNSSTRFDSFLGIPSFDKVSILAPYDNLTIQHCSFEGKNVAMYIHAEGIKFVKTKIDVDNVDIYDTFLFDKSIFTQKLERMFDLNHEFTCMHTKKRASMERKANSFPRIIAYFNNKDLIKPSDIPYKLSGSLKSAIGDVDFGKTKYIEMRSNNVRMMISKNALEADRLMNSSRHIQKYPSNYNTPKTTDGFFVMFYKLY